jgi:hypothetical protein
VLDETSQDAFERVSDGTAKSGDGDDDVGDDSEAFEGVSDGADESSGGGVWGVVTLTKRLCPPDDGYPYASPSSPSAGESEALAVAEEEPPVFRDVDGYDGPPEYGGGSGPVRRTR